MVRSSSILKSFADLDTHLEAAKSQGLATYLDQVFDKPLKKDIDEENW